MKKVIVVIAALIIVAVAGYYLIGGSAKTIGGVTGNVVSENYDGMKTFVLTGENFKFVMDGKDNPDIRVKQGDKVRIEFTSIKGFHDWAVDEFGAKTKQVRDTEGITFVEFVADKKGTFEYYCSIGEHRQQGMKGNLIVE